MVQHSFSQSSSWLLDPALFLLNAERFPHESLGRRNRRDPRRRTEAQRARFDPRCIGRWSERALVLAGDFLAEAKGAIDTSKQAPVKGSYNEVSAMGLVWSMKSNAKHVPSYQPQPDLGSQVIEFQLIRNGQQVASAQMEQLSIADGVRRITIDGQLHGVLLLPNTTGPHPGVLVVGGSEGGIPLGKAAWLASRGYAALALAYFQYDGLPLRLEGVPLECFSSALA
jgi:hypothetical protein